MTKSIRPTLIEPKEIYVDSRALQDPDYQFRGIGYHSLSILVALRRYSWKLRPIIIAIIDVKMGDIPKSYLSLFDRIEPISRIMLLRKNWFICLSPMTHSPIDIIAHLTNPNLFKIAIVYDFIPIDYPDRYLKKQESYDAYLKCFSWLNRYNAFSAISEHTKNCLIHTRNIEASKISVSGVAVRRQLEMPEYENLLSFSERKHIIVSGGGDPRKNPEVVIRTHACTKNSILRSFPLRILGNYTAADRNIYRNLYAAEGGDNTNLYFENHLSDDRLRKIYREAIVTIVPSQAEGFSIPIIESAANNTPVIVSDVGPHRELVQDKALRFPPEEYIYLQDLLENFVTNQDVWEHARQYFSQLWPRYTSEVVGERFLTGLVSEHDRHIAKPALLRSVKPKISILTPLPPAASGVADYSDVTLTAMSHYAEITVFTDTPNAISNPTYHIAGPVKSASRSLLRYDATVSVLGNSSYHLNIFNHLLQYGGPAIAHDARMINFYRVLLGQERTQEVASKELGTQVSDETIIHWLHNQHELPILFMSEIVRASSPLIVHSTTTVNLIENLYKSKPKFIPFAQYRRFDLSRVNDLSRHEARRRLGLKGDFIISSFGIVSPDKAPDILIWSLSLLRTWGIKACLIFCGPADPNLAFHIKAHASHTGVGEFVTIGNDLLDSVVYNDYLYASDAAVQLRTHAMGSISGALSDCIEAAIPTVANMSLASALDAPEFVRRVPDHLSAVLIAEALLEIINSGHHLSRPISRAKVFAQTHSPQQYAALMMNALGFEIEEKTSGYQQS